jgi:hypothetical protein
MRTGALVVLLSALVSCSGRGGLFRQYEYEEDMYLSLDGSATVYVNSSIPALNALRGATFDARPDAPADLAAVRAWFTTPVTSVGRVSSTRRRGRRFVHVRLEVDDVRRLSEARPFAWSSYRFDRNGEIVVFRQTVAAPAGPKAPVRWDGDEVVAFRLHAPSRILFHNTPLGETRGSILAWEQPLSGRLAAGPIEIEARMESHSILARTLLIFGGAIAAVAVTFAGAIWWIVRRG